MNIIAIVSRSWGIGYKGNLLFDFPSDMQKFVELTANKIVVMGSVTYNSLREKPLKNRYNIVLTKKKHEKYEYNYKENNSKLLFVKCVNDVFDTIKDQDFDDVFIIGGGIVYEQFLNYCKKAFITFVDIDILADTFLTNLFKQKNWNVVDKKDTTEKGCNLTHYVFENNDCIEYYKKK